MSKIQKDTFIPKSNTSYSAGIAFLLNPVADPLLLLVLQREGEKNAQKVGKAFIEQRSWKMPMGHFDSRKDANLLDTATREFQEETGFMLDFRQASVHGNVILRIPSQRPGYDFHEDHFFLVTSNTTPEETKRERPKNRNGFVFSVEGPAVDRKTCRQRCSFCAWASEETCRIAGVVPRLPQNS